MDGLVIWSFWVCILVWGKVGGSPRVSISQPELVLEYPLEGALVVRRETVDHGSSRPTSISETSTGAGSRHSKLDLWAPSPCQEDSYMWNPNDCSGYFRCVLGDWGLYNCPDGLLWNDNSKRCDWPQNVKCWSPETTPLDGPTAPTGPTPEPTTSIAPVPSSGDLSDLSCEAQVEGGSFGHHCFSIHMNETHNWEDAEVLCVVRGGRLAIIADQPTNVVDYLYRKYPGQVSFWVGGSDRANEGEWLWMNGQGFDEAFPWSEGEPNDHKDGEDCLTVNYHKNYFNDQKCSDKMNYICEIDVPTITHTTIPTSAPLSTSDRCMSQYKSEITASVKVILESQNESSPYVCFFHTTFNY